LTPDALSEVEAAFRDPSVGFVYSDWCEILPSGESGRYPEGWAFGYGSHYWNDEHGVWAMRAPELNATTVRHIVSAPNHVRAWRADVYRQIGGHNPALTVADDYELFLRTYLHTKCHHIPKLLYRQHIGAHTAQRQRNALIQVEVARLSAEYDERLFAHG
jgi:hypothetical protein